jgi:putative oxidoreductase
MPALGLVVLRLTLATALLAHGGHQLFGLFAGPGVGPGGLSAMAAHYSGLGLEPGLPVAVFAGLIQVIGGLLIGVGLLTRWASAAVIGYLAIEVWKDQWRWGFFLNWAHDAGQGHGVENSLLLGGAALCLLLCGGGEFSIDGRRARSAASRESARARLRTRA